MAHRLPGRHIIALLLCDGHAGCEVVDMVALLTMEQPDNACEPQQHISEAHRNSRYIPATPTDRSPAIMGGEPEKPSMQRAARA